MSGSAHTSERRQFGRRKVSVNGQIDLPLRQLLPCKVHDFSPTGAQLEVDTHDWLPSKFHLLIGKASYECAVRHRDGAVVGVAFTGGHCAK